MYDEALTKNAASFFPNFLRFQDFYLAGGTALALQIGHRVSVDFDLFSFHELSPNLLQKIKKVFTGSKITLTYRAPEQLNLLIDGVKFTFFHFPYPLVTPLVRYKKIPLASIRELAVMKAFAIGKRLAYKDYVDWYFLLKERHVGLPSVIRLAKQKFHGDFNDRLFLGQLVSLEDVPTQTIDFLRHPVSRKEIQKFLEQVVARYTKSLY